MKPFLNKYSIRIFGVYHYMMLLNLVLLGLTQHVYAQKSFGTIQIKIFPVFNRQPIELSHQAYITPGGDTIQVNDFQFYMSHLYLKNTKSMPQTETNSYHLFQIEDSATYTISFPIAQGTYDAFGYSIGVDSLKNTQGAMSGDLDPIRGMYWAWNTGYIAAKLVGQSSSCPTLHHAFEFHIGGYLNPYHAFRSSQIQLPEIKIVSGKTTTLELYADIAEWFKTPSTILLKDIHHVVLPNSEAMKLADNYLDMIKLKSIINP